MEVTATKSLPAIAAMSVLFLLSPGVCRATAVESESGKTPSLFSAGHPENGLVADADWQSEFMMDSEISRMLLDVSGFVAGSTDNKEKQAINPCGRGKRYLTCVPRQNPVPKGEHCSSDSFNRICYS